MISILMNTAIHIRISKGGLYSVNILTSVALLPVILALPEEYCNYHSEHDDVYEIRSQPQPEGIHESLRVF